MLPLRGQSGPGSDGNEGVLRIPQSSSIAGTSLSNCLVSYPEHSLGGVLPLCREAVGVFYSPSRLGKRLVVWTPLLIITPGRVGISQVAQFLKKINKQTTNSGWKKKTDKHDLERQTQESEVGGTF